MNPPVKLVAFAGALALAFGGAAVAGDAIGPEPDADAPAAHSNMTADHKGTPVTTAPHGADAGHEQAAHDVRGLAVAEDGLRLVVDDAELRRGATERLRFRIVGDDGATVRDFDVEHEKRMHLILARRDLTGFQHLHPTQASDGSWTVNVTIPDAGSYRVFADFVHEDDPHTLASDLRVDGRADLRDLPAPTRVADAGAGYEVELADADELRFSVRRDGQNVHVEPYLGADGHLVALREGDLAFLHVHPTDHGDAHGQGHDDSIGFEATFPTTGRYRLFLQFKHEGRVHTAAYTKEVR